MNTKVGPLSRAMLQHKNRCLDGDNSTSPDVIPDKVVALSILVESLVKKNKNLLLSVCKGESTDDAKSNIMQRVNRLLHKFIGDNLLFYQGELTCDVVDRIIDAGQKRPGSIVSSPTGTGKTRIASMIELCVNPSAAAWLRKKLDELFPLCDDTTVRLDSEEYKAIIKKRTGSASIEPPLYYILNSLRTPFRKLRQALTKIFSNSIGATSTGPSAVSYTEFTLFATPTNLILQSAAEIARFHELVGLDAKDKDIRRPVVITLGPMSAKSGHLALMSNAPACGRLYSAEKALAAIKNYKGKPLFSTETIETISEGSEGNFLQDATAAFFRENKRAIGIGGFDGIGVATRNVIPCVLLDIVERIFTNYGFVRDSRDDNLLTVSKLLSGFYSDNYGTLLDTESRIRQFIKQTVYQTSESTKSSVSKEDRRLYTYKCIDSVRQHRAFQTSVSLDNSKDDLESFTSGVLSGKKIKSKGLYGPILENIYHTIASIYNNKVLRERLKSLNKASIKDFTQRHVAFASKDIHGCSASWRLLKILTTDSAIFPPNTLTFKTSLDKLKFMCQIILFACVSLLEFYSEHTLMVHHLTPFNIIKFSTIMNLSTIVDRTAISVLDCFLTGIIGDKDNAILLTDEVDFLRTRETVSYRSIAMLQPNFMVKVGMTATIINNKIDEFTNTMSVIGQSIMVSQESLEEFLAIGKNSKTYDHANRLPLEYDGARLMNIMAFPSAMSGLIRCITAMVIGGKLYSHQISQRERDVVKRIYTTDIHEYNTTFTDPHIHSRIHLFQNSFKAVLDMIPTMSPTAGGKCHGGIKYDTLKTQITYHLIINQLYSNAKKALGKRNNAERKIVYVPFRSKAEKDIYDALSSILETYIRRKEAHSFTASHNVVTYPKLFYGCLLNFLRAFTESPEAACTRLLAKSHFDPTGPYKQLSAATLKYNTADAINDPEIFEKVYNPEFIPILRPMKTLEEIQDPSLSSTGGSAMDDGEGDDDDITMADEDETSDKSLKILPYLPKEILYACHRYLQNAHSSSLAQAESADREEMKAESVDRYHIGTKFVAFCNILQNLISKAIKEKKLTHSIVSLNTKNAILTLYDLLLNTRAPNVRIIIWSTESKIDAIKKELATTKCHCIILGNAKLIARGFNLHEVDNIFDLDSEFNPVVANQMAGRGLRLTNKDSMKRIIYISIQGTVDEAVNHLHQIKNASSDTITSNIIDISSAVSDAIKSMAISGTIISSDIQTSDEDDDAMEVEDYTVAQELDTTSRSRERRILALKLDHASSIQSDRNTDPDYTPKSSGRKRKHSDITTATEKTISAIGKLTKASVASGKKTTLASLLIKTHDKTQWSKEKASVSPYELYQTSAIELDASSGRFTHEGIDASNAGRALNLLSSTFLLDYVPESKRQKLTA